MPIVGVTKIASALNLEVRRVQQLVHEGMPREARGQYDPIKCAAWYIRYLQRVIDRKIMPTLDGGDAGERAARVRILQTQADLKEIEVAKQRSQLVAIPDVEAAFADLARTTEAHIMAIPPRLAPELVGETSRVMMQGKLESAIEKAVARLAKSRRDEISADPNLAKEVVTPNS